MSKAAEGWSVSLHWSRIWVGRFAVLVPAHVEELHEANVALGQPTGEQAVGGEGAGLVNVRAVHVQDFFWLLGDVG